MALDNTLVSQFAKVMTGDRRTKDGTTVNGTTVAYGGKMFVKLDGSDILTPMSTTAAVEDDERVLVMIKDHKATIIGNATSPSVGAKTVEDIAGQKVGVFDLVVTERIEAEIGKFDEILTGRLIADYAEINKLIATKISAEEVEANYIKADLAELDEAWIDDLIVRSSFLSPDVNSATGSFSTRLEAVNIYGDSIVSNTIKADSLIIKGTDGIYRRLNIDSLGQTKVDSDSKYNNQLDGSVIVANSITASKINVTDLFAQQIKATGTITGATLKGTTGDFTGTITAKYGKIGFLTVLENRLWGDFVETNYTDYEMSKEYFNATVYPSTATKFDQHTALIQLNSSGYAHLHGKTGINIRSNGSIQFSKFDNSTTRFVSIDLAGTTADTLSVAGSIIASGVVKSEGKQVSTTDHTHDGRYIGTGYVYGSENGGTGANSLTTDYHKFVFNKTGTYYSYGFLDVYKASGTGFSPNGAVPIIYQINRDYSSNSIAVRRSTNNGTSWSEWNAVSYTNHNHDGTYSKTSHTHSTISNNGYSLLQANNGNVYSQAETATCDLGVSTKRWKTIYSQNALNTGSDIRLKENISYDMDVYIQLLDMLKPMSFTWKSDVDDPDIKRHISYGAQYVWKALKNLGLSDTDFAGVHREMQEDGSVYAYSLCKEEFIPILHARQDRDKAELMEYISELEKRIATLESKGENQNG